MAVVKLENGELRDQIREAIYDSEVIEATGSVVRPIPFFSSITVAGQPKSLARTNLEQAGQFTAYNSFRVQGISMDAQNFNFASRDVLPGIQRNASIEFIIGTKTYYRGPMTFVGGRLHEYASIIATESSGSRVAQRLGEQAVQGVVLEGKHSVDIEPLYTFRMQYNLLQADCTPAEVALLTNLPARLILVASLKGLRRRPVQ